MTHCHRPDSSYNYRQHPFPNLNDNATAGLKQLPQPISYSQSRLWLQAIGRPCCCARHYSEILIFFNYLMGVILLM